MTSGWRQRPPRIDCVSNTRDETGELVYFGPRVSRIRSAWMPPSVAERLSIEPEPLDEPP